MTRVGTRAGIVGLSVLAAPVIGIAAFAVIAFVFRAFAWPLGLIALVGVPAACSYWVGRRVVSPGLGVVAAVAAAISSLVTVIALLVYAFDHASFG